MPEYLPTRQACSKWQDTRPNLKEGDLVLRKVNQAKRNESNMVLLMSAKFLFGFFRSFRVFDIVV